MGRFCVHATDGKCLTMALLKWQKDVAKSLGHDENDLEGGDQSADELTFWEEFHFGCPWRAETGHVDERGQYYCKAIVWQSGQTRPCVIGDCAPYHFVKSLVKAASRSSEDG